MIRFKFKLKQRGVGALKNCNNKLELKIMVNIFQYKFTANLKFIIYPLIWILYASKISMV